MALAVYDNDRDYNDDAPDQSGVKSRRREFEDYASVKDREINEQRKSWRYYHADQWTPEQLRILRKRGQPAITFDRTGRKIDSLVGTIRRLRTDCKCFPNTPRGEAGAEVATQVVRTICDASRYEDLETECCRDAAVHGIGVCELLLTQGDQQDPDLLFEYRDPKTFFYDPRSLKYDFTDGRFHGIYKWVDVTELDELVEGAADFVNDSDQDYNFTAFDQDREQLWTDSRERRRLVDHWYKEGGIWKWCLHVGSAILMAGDSPFYDERNQSISKYFAFANQIDIDGDHYGFVRRLQGPQDAMNQHRSKSIHIMNTRQLKIREGVVDDIEVARREAARPDGVLVYTGDPKELEVIQPEQEFLQQTQYYQDAKNEIDQFGPNQALMTMTGQNTSGRAFNQAQQAGLAEIGPFLKNFRMWKLSQYRAAWCAAQRYWTAQRFLRVTADQGVAQFMMINGMQLDQWGRPQLVNVLGQIDVDIHIDEGPDTETIMGDVFDTLMALSQNNVPVPPAAIIEASYLPSKEKQKLIQMVTAPDPVKQQAVAAQMGKTQAETQELQSKAALNMAKAQTEGMPKQDTPPPPKTPLDIAEQMANIRETNATADHKLATSRNLDHKALMAPIELLSDLMDRGTNRGIDHMHRNVDRLHDNLHRNADRAMEQRERSADSEAAAEQAREALRARASEPKD